MAHVIILAGSAQEANTYRRAAVLPRGRTVWPTSAAQIDGVVPSEVHTLPGFRRRADKHAIIAALKRASRRYQGIRWVDVDERGPLTPRVLEVAHRYDRLRGDEKPQWQQELDAILEPEGWEPPETLTAAEVLTLAANPDSRGADLLDDTSNGGNMEAEGAPAATPRARRRRASIRQAEQSLDPEDIFGDI